DSRKAGGTGRSDAMILVSINKSKKEIVSSSLLRDIYLQIPGKGNNRLNAAYAFGGANLLLDTIEENFKVKVDKYAAVDFYSFMSIVDAVEGVTLEVTKEEIPIINSYVKELNKLTGQDESNDFLTEPGLLHLNGKQALGYARNRYIGSDFERTARQRRVLEQVFLKVKSADLIQINELLNTFLPQVTSNITEAEVFSLILSLPAYSGYELKQLSIPVKNSYSFMRIEGMSVIGIDFEKNIEVMYNEIY
ncbi:MAG: LytR family transcriptional regulator, partial [Clostridiales bacterium]|nr:LytR family transcriptional regulator [Clostridiales bacterium]